VACARAASLPETAGHAALYFDPKDSEDMADRMVTITANRDLARECRTRGLERVKDFSWDTCAARTLSLIQKTAGA
jgi:glycosyltransferase involved in cell wall biosynthesis